MPEVLSPEERQAAERLGSVVGRKWRLERLLGLGGMAAVYAASGPDGAVAAVKVLHPEMSRREDIRKRFAQEATAATRVGHPGAVAVLEQGEDPDGTAFLVLELLDGEPLSALLKREGGLPLPRLLDVLDQVLDVLAAAHAQGIVHRDLKPDNLFVTTSGRIKVLDFGIARVLESVPGAYKTRTGITLGTVPFMSPEQALGKRDQVDGRSDLFSLGAMTFRIVAGRNVHQGDTEAEVLVSMCSRPAPPLASVAPSSPPGLRAVVDLALAFSKDSRYPDAATMQADVRALSEGKPPPHATRMLQARETATRVDLVAPVTAVPRKSGATVPEATASTQPDVTTRAAMAPTEPDLSRAAAPLARVATALEQEPPETAPPSSLRAIAMPAVADMTELAATVKNPAFGAPTTPAITVPAGPTGPTLVSSPPAVPVAASPGEPGGTRRRAWLPLAGLAVAVVGVGVYVGLSKPEGPPAAASSSDVVPAAEPGEAPATGVNPTTGKVTSEHPASSPRPAPRPAATGPALAAAPAPTEAPGAAPAAPTATDSPGAAPPPAAATAKTAPPPATAKPSTTAAPRAPAPKHSTKKPAPKSGKRR